MKAVWPRRSALPSLDKTEVEARLRNRTAILRSAQDDGLCFVVAKNNPLIVTFLFLELAVVPRLRHSIAWLKPQKKSQARRQVHSAGADLGGLRSFALQ